MNKLSLGERMKQYEEVFNYVVLPRLPIVGRIDGKSFHTLTRKLKCKKPFDNELSRIMVVSAKYLSEQVQGCLISYVQSDEISFILRNDQSYDSQPWFGNRVQKIVSVASSAVSAVFNRNFGIGDPIAMFDCRIFCVPNLMEAYNYLVWRQQDCVKNSISSTAHDEISRAINKETNAPYGRKGADKLLHGLNQSERQELLFKLTNKNWNNYPERFKRGIALFRSFVKIDTENGPVVRRRWTDIPAPHFTGEQGKLWALNVLNSEDEEERNENSNCCGKENCCRKS